MEQDEIKPSENSLPIPRYGVAVAETLGSSMILFSINRFIRQADYAYISWDSMLRNLTSFWVWDQDEFNVNQLGHPYQGSFYYIAGRSNGLNFWASSGLTLFGSVLWELLAETETPSINDLITTPTGGIAIGETFHRMYVALDSMQYPIKILKFFFSPLDAVNDLVFGKPERDSSYSSLYLDETYLAAGGGVFFSRMDPQRNGEGDYVKPSFLFDLSIVYGDPYLLKTKVPYQNFGLFARANLAYPYFAIDLFSDGDLYTFGLWDTGKYAGSLSLNLHYDFIFGSLINFSANSLGLTYRSHNTLRNNWDLSWKFHANWVFLGASEFLRIWYGNVPYADPGAEHRNYDFSTGGGIKNYLNIRHPEAGTFNVSLYAYYLYTIPNTVPENGSPGFSVLAAANASYEHKLAAKWFLGFMASAYLKYGYYTNSPDVFEALDYYTLYVKKRF